jgi:hypothetical protein
MSLLTSDEYPSPAAAIQDKERPKGISVARLFKWLWA